MVASFVNNLVAVGTVWCERSPEFDRGPSNRRPKAVNEAALVGGLDCCLGRLGCLFDETRKELFWGHFNVRFHAVVLLGHNRGQMFILFSWVCPQSRRKFHWFQRRRTEGLLGYRILYNDSRVLVFCLGVSLEAIDKLSPNQVLQDKANTMRVCTHFFRRRSRPCHIWHFFESRVES